MAANTPPPEVETGLLIAIITPIAVLIGAIATKLLEYLGSRSKTSVEAEVRREEIAGETTLEIRKLEVENQQTLLSQIHQEQRQIREYLRGEIARLSDGLVECRRAEETCRRDLAALRERVDQLENLRKRLSWDSKTDRRRGPGDVKEIDDDISRQ